MTPIIEAIRKAYGWKFPAMGHLANKYILGMLPRIVAVELFSGIRAELDLDDETQRATYWQGARFETPTPQILRHWLRPRATMFFDIGSNYGFFSYWMLTLSPQIQVSAFEPNPKTFAKLERIKEANNLSRLHPYNLGLSDEAASLELHPGKNDSGHSTFGNHPEIGHEVIGTIPVMRFDDWREQKELSLPNQPEWVAKIDVEGYEMKVLKGMEISLRAKAFRGLAVEMNEFTLGFCGTKPAEIVRFLEDCGYVDLGRKAIGKQWALHKTVNAFFEPTEH